MKRARAGDREKSWRGSGQGAFAASVPEGAQPMPNVRGNEAPAPRSPGHFTRSAAAQLAPLRQRFLQLLPPVVVLFRLLLHGGQLLRRHFPSRARRRRAPRADERVLHRRLELVYLGGERFDLRGASGLVRVPTAGIAEDEVEASAALRAPARALAFGEKLCATASLLLNAYARSWMEQASSNE